MIEVEGQRFDNRRIPIDGTRFVDCEFANCKLIFGASDTVAFDRCVFDECVWVFEGAALITLQLMSALYSGLGLEGVRLVEAIVDGVRQGTIGRRLFQPEVAAVA